MRYQKQLLILSLTLLTASGLRAQDTTAYADDSLRIDHIAVYVHDLAESTEFYKSVLRFRQIPEPFNDGRHSWFSLGAIGQLHLIQGAADSLTHDKNGHLCFSVPSVERFAARLEANSVPYEDWPGAPQTITTRVDGVQQIYFQDPDGHWIEINDAAFVKRE